MEGIDAMSEEISCPICKRITPSEYLEKHHFIPRSKKGKETVLVCCSCGDMLHKLFTNKELAKKYNSLETILASEDVQKWVAWVSKKPNDFSICMAAKKKK